MTEPHPNPPRGQFRPVNPSDILDFGEDSVPQNIHTSMAYKQTRPITDGDLSPKKKSSFNAQEIAEGIPESSASNLQSAWLTSSVPQFQEKLAADLCKSDYKSNFRTAKIKRDCYIERQLKDLKKNLKLKNFTMAYTPFTTKAQKDWPPELFSTFNRLSSGSTLGGFLKDQKTTFQSLNMFDPKHNEIQLFVLDDMIWAQGKKQNNFNQPEFYEGPLDPENYLLTGFGFSVSEANG